MLEISYAGPQASQNVRGIVEPSARKPMVVEALDDLMQNVATLEERAKALIIKLAPIMSDSPANEKNGEIPQPKLPPVPGAIQLASYRVRRAAAVLLECIERSEV